MVTGNNVSKTASTEEYVDIKKYIGVASVSILAINPNNEKLRKFGWSVPEGADEPKYVTTTSDGKKSARVRFLVQIQDLDEKPVVALDFWIRPDIMFNKDATKARVIDSFVRTAWGTKDEIKAHRIPQYSNGPANINSDYKPCHVGEEELASFIYKFLNVTPFQTWSRTMDKYVPTKNPGHLTIDRWSDLCNGNITELAEFVSLQPDNKVKVILGVRTTDDNKTYQTFLPTCFIGNGAPVDRNTGEYISARKAIDRYEAGRDNPYSFSALPVREWGVSATVVKDNAETVEIMPEFVEEQFGEGGDLPF